MEKEEIPFEVFDRTDLRVGRVLEASVSEKARPPALRLVIDFGPLGIRKSSARITDLYEPSQIIDKQIIALVNVPPRQVATVRSECLVMGAVQKDGSVVLLEPGPMAQPGDPVK